MKIKCCGQSKKQKEEITMGLGDVRIYQDARNCALKLYDITKDHSILMDEEQLGTLLSIVASITYRIKTEKDKKIGTGTCCTSTINKPITINMPGIGNVQYTGD